jgi:hypothetical protein
MTIASTTSQVLLPANGIATQFAFPNKIFQAADLIVTIIDLVGNQYPFAPSGVNTYTNATLGISYTVFNIDVDAGCFITFTAPPTNLWSVDMRTAIAETQSTSIKNQGAFNPELHEEFFDKITREIQDLRRLTYTFGIHGPDIESAVWTQLPSAAARANTLLGFTAAGLPTIAPSLATVLTQAAFNVFLGASPPYAITADETTAGAVIVNPQYLPGWVDRYLANAVPGTTDMTSAFNMAAKVAALTGCEVNWGPTAPYRLNSPVNCTVMRGVVFNDRSSANLSNNTPSVLIGHNGNGFDLAGSVETTWNNVVVENVSANTPQAIWFTGRVAGASCGLHRFNNCRTAFATKAGWVFYGIGSEENTFFGCTFYQNANGSGIINHNVSNLLGLLSSFQTLSAGTSGTENHHYGFGYYQLGNSGANTETVFYLEQASNTTIRDGTWGNAHGLAYINAVGAGAMTNLTLDSIRGEPLGTKGLNGILVQNTGVNTQWTINNVNVDTTGYLLNFQAAQTPQIQNLIVTASSSTSGFGLNAYTMSNSDISFLGGNIINGQAGGNVSGNTFRGWRSQVTLSGTTSTPNIYIDNNSGQVGIDGDLFTATSAACTGALTVNAIWTLRLSPNGKEVTLSLPSTLGNTTAAGSFTYGVVIPAAYRPANTLRYMVCTQDNSIQFAGTAVITNTGTILITRDVTGNNFTNAAPGGLTSQTILKWIIGV